jgi:hypothetical protein
LPLTRNITPDPAYKSSQTISLDLDIGNSPTPNISITNPSPVQHRIVHSTSSPQILIPLHLWEQGTISAHTAQSVETTHKPNSPAVTEPPPTITSVTALFGPIDPPNDPPIDPNTTMSINATITSPNPPNNGMKGMAPSIFNGDCSHSEAFWNEFCCYRLLNCNNKSVKVLFFRVLTALSYIKGPLIGDWVNARDEELE